MKPEEVKTMCDELLVAFRQQKITLDQLEYELAKLTLEMIADYAPKSEPHMTGELARFQTMGRSEWAAFSPDQLKAAEARFTELRAKYKSAVSHVRADNNSNLHWLKICRDSLQKNNHAKWMLIQNLIADHQGVAA